jgi:hypothetical protein
VAPERRGGRQDFLREIEPVVKIGAEMLDVNEHLIPKHRGCARGKSRETSDAHHPQTVDPTPSADYP